VRDPRSWGLVFCAGVCASRAGAYLGGTKEQLPVGLREAALVLPVPVYGVMWALAAVGAVVIAIRRWPPRWWNAWLVAPPMLWGAFYFTAALVDPKAGFSAALLFWCLGGIFACFIMEPPRMPRMRRDRR
jgi:hypothetical protein